MNTAEDAEARIRNALDGKFFLTDGRDLCELKREQEELTAHRRHEEAIRQQQRRLALMAKNSAKIEMQELRRASTKLTPRHVLVAVSYAHGIPIAAILGPSRERKTVAARQHACYVMRHLLKMAYPKIADELARDHTTAMHSANTWAHLQKRHPNEVATVSRMLAESENEYQHEAGSRPRSGTAGQ